MPANNPFEAVRDHVAPRPPPTETFDRVVYGLTQPLLGARMLATHRPLFEAALVPVALLAVFCAVVALISDGDGGFFHRFYTTFAVLAPLPSIVFASHYARLAVQARHAFGFSHVEPCIEPLSRVLKRAVKQAILIGLALAPFTALLHAVPGGWLLVKASAAVWALHWVVVDAFDSARVLRPGDDARLRAVDRGGARGADPEPGVPADRHHRRQPRARPARGRGPRRASSGRPPRGSLAGRRASPAFRPPPQPVVIETVLVARYDSIASGPPSEP